MKYYKFTVFFKGHTSQEIYATNIHEATILAQAKQIKAGLSYQVQNIFESND